MPKGGVEGYRERREEVRGQEVGVSRNQKLFEK